MSKKRNKKQAKQIKALKQSLVSVRNDYDATKSKGKRRAPKSSLRSEDRELLPDARNRLVATTRDLPRNFVLVAWMIRKHLDFVSSFTFQARMDPDRYPGLNDIIETFVEYAGQAENFDASGRYDWAEYIRISEACKTIDGDVFWLKLPTHGHIQAIEGDRIRQPDKKCGVPKAELAQWAEGIRYNNAQRAKALCVWNRAGDNFTFHRIVPARATWHLKTTPFRFDQGRGISPLASAINTLQDIYENIDLALCKAKVAQLFGMVFKRDAGPGMDGYSASPVDSESDDDPTYTNVLTGQPFQLELEPGDDAQFLANDSPGPDFQTFTIATTELALKALDLPYCFYDESHTNFYGSKTAVNHYGKSAAKKQRANQRVLSQWLRWRLALAVADGSFVLPSDLTVADVRFDWIPDGIPWIDTLKEVTGNQKAVDANFDSTTRIARSRGLDARDIIKENLELEKFEAQQRQAMDLPPRSQETATNA